MSIKYMLYFTIKTSHPSVFLTITVSCRGQHAAYSFLGFNCTPSHSMKHIINPGSKIDRCGAAPGFY